MRYILVTDRTPRTNRYCALCCCSLDGYLRELSTRIKYCGLGCYTEHCMSAFLALGEHDAPKLLAYEKGGLR